MYSLVIPQTICLSRSGGGEGPGTYTGTIPVCVKGTLSDNQYVTVSVDTPTLTCDDGTTVTTSLSAPKAEWTSAEVAGDGTSANFAVSTELAKPGEWSGTANFGCELGSTGPVIIEFNIGITGKYTTYRAEQGMTWKQWIESEYNTDGYKIITGGLRGYAPHVSTSDYNYKTQDCVVASYSDVYAGSLVANALGSLMAPGSAVNPQSQIIAGTNYYSTSYCD